MCGATDTCPLMACMMPAQPQGFNASQLMMLPGLRQIPTAGKARNFAQLLSGPDPCNLGLSPNTSMYVGSCQECQTLQVVAHGVAGGENESSCWLTQQHALPDVCAGRALRHAAGGSLPALLTLSCLLPLSLHKQGSVMGLQM